MSKNWDIDKEFDLLHNRYCLEEGFVLKEICASHDFMRKVGLEDEADCQAVGHPIWSLKFDHLYQKIDLITYDHTIKGCFKKMVVKMMEYFGEMDSEQI